MNSRQQKEKETIKSRSALVIVIIWILVLILSGCEGIKLPGIFASATPIPPTLAVLPTATPDTSPTALLPQKTAGNVQD